MSKHTTQQQANFGRRLASLRKAASYTQQQLADEIGVTRRMIAYYETESDYPPASLLVDLAKALNTTTDALLGIQPVTTPKMGQRLHRRFQQVETLEPKARKQIIQLLDTFIEAEQIKQQAKAEH